MNGKVQFTSSRPASNQAPATKIAGELVPVVEKTLTRLGLPVLLDL